jgi:hypothetical protein
MLIYAVITSTKLVMKLKLVSLESGSSPHSNDAISVSIRCIVWKIFAFKTTPLKNDTFQPDENELRSHDCNFRSPMMKTLDWSVETLGHDYNSTGLCNNLFKPE